MFGRVLKCEDRPGERQQVEAREAVAAVRGHEEPRRQQLQHDGTRDPLREGGVAVPTRAMVVRHSPRPPSPGPSSHQHQPLGKPPAPPQVCLPEVVTPVRFVGPSTWCKYDTMRQLWYENQRQSTYRRDRSRVDTTPYSMATHCSSTRFTSSRTRTMRTSARGRPEALAKPRSKASRACESERHTMWSSWYETRASRSSSRVVTCGNPGTKQERSRSSPRWSSSSGSRTAPCLRARAGRRSWPAGVPRMRESAS